MTRVANSLETLRKQLNELFPNRSKVSDGGVGDQAHSKRKSDHNPNSAGVVTARDFTHDTVNLDCFKLLAALLAEKDRRIKYIIFNKKIYNVKDGFQAQNYSGVNAHKHHLHLSVSADPKLYDDASEWKLDFDAMPSESPTPSKPLLRVGSVGQEVRNLQAKLGIKVDGTFGMNTKLAVVGFQRQNGLTADGIVGDATRAKLDF